jgi:hypothetical protein
MPQTAQDVFNAINGVTFGQGSVGDATSAPGYGMNAAGGNTDVYTINTDAASGTVALANIDHLDAGNGTSVGTVVPAGSAGVVHAYYHYTAASGSDFATFGYLTFGNESGSGTKYYVHGFSQYGILLSPTATLTADDVNGVGSDGLFSGSNAPFEILSTKDLGSGPNSPIYGKYPSTSSTSSGPNYSYTNLYSSGRYIDNAGVTHYEIYSRTYGAYDGQPVDRVNHEGVNGPYDANLNPPTFPLVFSSDPTQFDINSIPCYAEGTRLLTARGEVAVENLEVGDEAITASGEARPVIWIGSRRVRCDLHASPVEVNPVRIRKGAFGEGQPGRDLVLSPGHAVFVDGVLIPAHALINGATVIQEAVERVRYFHIELDAHDVILAEGLPCESYLDDGNRTSFGNSPEFTALHGRLDPKSWEHACAPMVAAGPQLADVQRRLLQQAEALGWTRSEEPGLHLLADGVAIAPIMAKGDRLWFAAPAAAELALVSTASVLAHTLPGVTDPRRLGVAVSELKIDGHLQDPGGPVFGQGFHALEARGGHAWHWTDGHGRLALTLPEPAMLEVALLMIAPTWRRPAAQLRLVEAG